MTNLATLKFFVTPPHECSYLPDQEASSLFVDPAARMNMEMYAKLSAVGFRRSGDYLYRPHCAHCNACVPVRIPVAGFRMRRSQRRIWKRNADLVVNTCPAEFRDEHYQLYERYITARHEEGDMFPPSVDQYEAFLTNRWGTTRFHEFRLSGRLVYVAVVDHMPNGLSAVYTYFDPEDSGRSPGMHAILWQIEEARRLGLPHVYLGYWIRECRKMSYKTRFRPVELYREDQWIRAN